MAAHIAEASKQQSLAEANQKGLDAADTTQQAMAEALAAGATTEVAIAARHAAQEAYLGAGSTSRMLD